MKRPIPVIWGQNPPVVYVLHASKGKRHLEVLALCDPKEYFFYLLYGVLKVGCTADSLAGKRPSLERAKIMRVKPNVKPPCSLVNILYNLSLASLTLSSSSHGSASAMIMTFSEITLSKACKNWLPPFYTTTKG